MSQPPPPYEPPLGPPYGPPPYGPPSFGPPPFPPPYAAPYPPPRKRRALPVVIAALVALLLVGAAVLVPVLLSRGGDEDDDPVATDVDTSDLSAVQEFDDLTTRHLEPGEDHDYPQAPSVGGDHAPVWLECGVYDEPLPEVNVVHDLEHGTIWLTYRPDLVDADGVQQLADQVPDNGIMSPYPDQEAPVVITVWGRQLALVGPDDPRIALFVAEFGAGDTAPEPFASCHGGVDPADLPATGGTVA